MSYIFVIGPAYNNLNTLLNTININNKILKNIKHFYIPTNDMTIYNYFKNIKCYNITCDFYHKNQGHQLSCYNCIIAGMKMLLINEEDINNDDIVIFSHEDCYLNDLLLFNKAVNKLKIFDIVCRKFIEKRQNKQSYYMNDTFIIKKNVIHKTFSNLEILNDFLEENNKDNRFCEYFFSKIITKLKIYSISYHHTTWEDTELGFFHIPSRKYIEKKWDKENIDIIYNEDY